MKHPNTWAFMAGYFKLKGPTFQRMITNFMKVIEPFAYELFVEKVAHKYTMKKLIEDNTVFQFHPYAIEAIDVKFQPANRPKGSLAEGKDYWSEKHRSYGYKVEVSVRPNGMASDFSYHHGGSESDFSILVNRVNRTQARIRKEFDEEGLPDNGILREEYPYSWAIIADKGYQGIAEHIRSITPKKRPPNGGLTLAQTRNNRNISSDRIIVENFFGRLSQLWGVCSRKFTLSEVKYDTVLSLCVSLTNFHIDLHPLRATDGGWYNRYTNRLMAISESRTRSRSDNQTVYRSNQRQRTMVGSRSIPRILDD